MMDGATTSTSPVSSPKRPSTPVLTNRGLRHTGDIEMGVVVSHNAGLDGELLEMEEINLADSIIHERIVPSRRGFVISPMNRTMSIGPPSLKVSTSSSLGIGYRDEFGTKSKVDPALYTTLAFEESPSSIVGNPDQHLNDVMRIHPPEHTPEPKHYSTNKLQQIIQRIKQAFKSQTDHVVVHSKISPDSHEARNSVIPFIMQSGRALHTYGVPAYRLEYTLTIVTSSFGMEGNFFSTPTGIFFNFSKSSGLISPNTHLMRIEGGDLDMHKICLVERVTEEVQTGKLDCLDALDKLKEINHLAPLYPTWLSLVSYLMSSFAVSIMFSGGFPEMACATIIGGYVGVLVYLSSFISPLGRLCEVLSSFGAALIASFFNSYIYPVRIFVAALGGVIYLVPGLSLTISVAELGTRHLISGTSRMMYAFMCMIQLAFGLGVGEKAGELFFSLRDEVPAAVYGPGLETILLSIAGILSAIAYSVLLKVPWRQGWIILIACALGMTAGSWLSEVVGNDTGDFLGALAISLLGNLYARYSKTGLASVPTMTGIILLVPGSLGVKGLVHLASGDVVDGMLFLSSMFEIALCLSMGMLVAGFIVPPRKTL
eukprot:TRINITY_DN3148_c0_g1_i1.p1 TRINITY_DN3148_c0_g1~~TRINITY_DN3148_c0_g1_i1.p1  ORF type:complete len:599 (-),score=89.89 TRINITY_DN3148_c0_g1_i1:154-1950(-)